MLPLGAAVAALLRCPSGVRGWEWVVVVDLHAYRNYVRFDYICFGVIIVLLTFVEASG